MAKQREGRESEYYKGIIRQQRAEIKRLKRKIRELEKYSILQEPEEYETEIEPVVENFVMCPKCNIPLEEVKVVGRRFFRCNICGYRTKTEKANG